MIIGVLVFEPVSAVAVVAVVGVLAGGAAAGAAAVFTFTAGATFTFAAPGAAFPARPAGFAAAGGGSGLPNRFWPAAAPAVAGPSRDSASAAHTHAVIRAGLGEVGGRMDRSERRA
jgi:hypothetical protein